MYEKILVPLDGSKAAEIALPYAIELANKLGSHLFLVEVSELNTPNTEHYCQTYLNQVARQARLQLKKQENAETNTLQNRVLAGQSASEILRYADANSIDLIIMSSHGSSGEGLWSIGSIAEKVLRAAKQSVLLVKVPVSDITLQRKQLLKKILLPLDGSSVGEIAVPTAEVLSHSLGAELVLFRVVVPSSLQRDSIHDPTDIMEELVTQAEKGQEDRKASATKYLQGVEKQLMEKGLASSTVVVMGDPPDQILDYAEANRIDLIAMSSHGRGGLLRRWVFGSVTDKLLHAGVTPVLVVRARKA